MLEDNTESNSSNVTHNISQSGENVKRENSISSSGHAGDMHVADQPIRYTITADTAQARREYDEVVARYTNPDGTKKPGWMKAPNGKPTKGD